jgi:hypothetical protein
MKFGSVCCWSCSSRVGQSCNLATVTLSERVKKMNPYKVISDDATHVTYEYRSAYTWALYAALAVLFIGMTLPNDAFTTLGVFVAISYFVAKLALGRDATAHIKKAMQSNSVEISGNKASFSNPLRFRVPK